MAGAGRSVRGRNCHVHGCSNSSFLNPGLGFILAPTPDDPERRTVWLKLMNREDLIGIEGHIRLYVCECHFDPGDIKIVNQRKNLINMNVVPRLFLPAGNHVGPTLANSDAGTSGSEKRCAEVDIQAHAKRQRLKEMLHTEMDIKEDGTDDDGTDDDASDEDRAYEDTTDENRAIVEGPQSSLNRPTEIEDKLRDEEEELKYAIKVTKKEATQESEFSHGYNKKVTPQALLELLPLSAISDIDEVNENDATNFLFTGEPEMLISQPKLPSGFFELFLMSDILLQPIVDLTNEGISGEPVTIEEFKVFLGLLLYMGTFNFERVSDYFKQDRFFQTNFDRFMLRQRFITILNFLRFTPGEQDSIASVSPVVNHFNEVMRNIYVPGRELLVEESMWHLKQRTSVCFSELEDSEEPAAIRLYLLREPCGTVVKFHFEKYSDMNYKPFDKVFFLIAQDTLDVGRLLYFQSHQTSCELAAKLLARKTYCIGSLSEMPPNAPDAIVNIQLSTHEIESVSVNGMHIGKWKLSEDKEVIYVTTKPPARTFSIVNLDGKQVKVSDVVEMYCQTHFRLNSLLAQYYPFPVQQMSWQVKVFVHIIMLSLVNAHRLYSKFSGYKMDFSKFRMVVIRKLLPLAQESDSDDEVSDGPHRLERFFCRGTREKQLDNTKRPCAKCLKNGNNCLTLYQCRACPGAPSLCVKCFCDIHSS